MKLNYFDQFPKLTRPEGAITQPKPILNTEWVNTLKKLHTERYIAGILYICNM